MSFTQDVSLFLDVLNARYTLSSYFTSYKVFSTFYYTDQQNMGPTLNVCQEDAPVQESLHPYSIRPVVLPQPTGISVAEGLPLHGSHGQQESSQER